MNMLTNSVVSNGYYNYYHEKTGIKRLMVKRRLLGMTRICNLKRLAAIIPVY